MRKIFMVLVALSVGIGCFADVTVQSVTAKQRYPWNGLVDIAVTIQGPSNDVSLADCLFAATNSATKAAIPITHITRNGVSGSGTIWMWKFVWDAKADVGAVRIDDVALTVDAKILGGVQLWENGPYWAECNIGANQPEESGYYFWWGDTVGYRRNRSRWDAVDGSRTGFSFDASNCPTYGKNISLLQTAGYINASGTLVAAHDAATAHLGTPWRMPTDAEMLSLISNCTATWTTRNGVNGRLVTGKGAYASKSIFLPAAGNGHDSKLDNLGSYGDYWTSMPYRPSAYAWRLYFDSSDFGLYEGNMRCTGLSVRPVREFPR